MDFGALLKDELSTYKRNKWEGKLGENDVVLYSRPVSAQEVDDLSQTHKNLTSNAAMVDLIIIKAELEDGTKALNKGSHRNSMLRLMPAKINEIYFALFAGELDDAPSDEDLEKN